MVRVDAERRPELCGKPVTFVYTYKENEGVPSKMRGSKGTTASSLGVYFAASCSTRAPGALCQPSPSSRANLSNELLRQSCAAFTYPIESSSVVAST